MRTTEKFEAGPIRITFVPDGAGAGGVRRGIAGATRGRTMVVSTKKLLRLSGLFPSGAPAAREDSGTVFCVLPGDGESCKTVGTAGRILRALLANGFQKSDTLLAIGGGTLCDVASFAASVYKRGMGLVLVPTTLLAMVDAAVGGKTAVNLGGIKNSAGTVYFPETTVVWPGFLDTLPAAEVECGLFEIVKSALIFSAPMLRRLERSFFEFARPGAKKVPEAVIFECASEKAELAAGDPFDRGARMLLNLGHTVGHAIEAASKSGVSHGHAVGAGLFAEAVIARELGVLADESVLPALARFIRTGRARAAFDSWLGPAENIAAVRKAMAQDKKALRGKKMIVPLVAEAGRCVLYEADVAAEIMPLMKPGLFLEQRDKYEKCRTFS